ncbi:MAG: (Fe-S)-binding protein [bacterium]
MQFKTWEQILLTVLVAGTVASFVKDLYKKIRLIAAGPSDRKRTDRLGGRFLRLMKEVFLQSRVIGGRPIAGLMHAVVFFGFLVFAFETIDHFLEAVRVPFLEPLLGSALPAFKYFLAGIAILVSLAVIGLAFRRFVLIKFSPDPKSYSSGLVALLILLLMLTYLNGMQAQPLVEKANWWLHVGIIIVFPHLILRSKHFHIVMTPITIFFRTHLLGDYMPLHLDMDKLAEDAGVTLGLENMAAVPWKMRMDFLTCVECKRCTDQCPAAVCDQELNPKDFILAGRAALQTNGPIPSVVGDIISVTALGQCTSCGACEGVCPAGIEHLQVLMGAKRSQALTMGTGMVATDFLETMERTGNPFATRADVRKKLVKEFKIPPFVQGKSEYLLWLGCVWAYNADARSSVAAMIKILNQANISYGVLEAEACCGHHSRRQGEEMQFQNFSRKNISALQEHGIRKVITPCPHCLHTLRREYPTLQSDFTVDAIHHSEFLAELIASGAITLKTSRDSARTVTYNDPCYLGRYENVYDAPRTVIRQSGCSFLELSRHGKKSFCCGGGSAGFVREQKVKHRIDQERKAEIKTSGAQVLVTACPECMMMLNAAVEETQDLAEFVAERMHMTES